MQDIVAENKVSVDLCVLRSGGLVLSIFGKRSERAKNHSRGKSVAESAAGALQDGTRQGVVHRQLAEQRELARKTALKIDEIEQEMAGIAKVRPLLQVAQARNRTRKKTKFASVRQSNKVPVNALRARHSGRGSAVAGTGLLC